MILIDTAYNQVQLSYFAMTNQELKQACQAITQGNDELKVMLRLREILLQADPALTLKNRITGLPLAYQNLYNFITPKLKQVDAKVLARYQRYGFVPLKFGSTVNYH